MPTSETAESQPTPPVAPGEWHRVAPAYIAVELISAAVFLVILAAIGVGIFVVFGVGWQWIPVGILGLLSLVTAAFTPRRVRAIGYQLRHDDLLFRRGIMWRRMVAVPYGRMQLIDINRGPLARAFKLADLKFVTASASSDLVIPGLPERDVDLLRDYLVAVAESRRTGL